MRRSQPVQLHVYPCGILRELQDLDLVLSAFDLSQSHGGQDARRTGTAILICVSGGNPPPIRRVRFRRPDRCCIPSGASAALSTAVVVPAVQVGKRSAVEKKEGSS